MKNLTQLREQIDAVDKQIVELFEQRMQISADVAKYKISIGKKVFDKEREQAKLASLKAMAHNDFNRHGVEELFQQIMSMSRKLQYQLLAQNGASGRLPFIAVDDIDRTNIRVVYQGVEGAYSHAAMRAYFGDDVNCFHVRSFRDAMEAIAEGAADYAVLPIENSSAGIVADNYDLLVNFENYIVGEQIVKCQHALLGLPGAKLSDIKTVYSHSQAPGTVRGISGPPSRVAARFRMTIRRWQQRRLLRRVIRHRRQLQANLLRRYSGLTILEEHIYYNEKNSTRFIVVTNQRIFRKDATKISICFETPHSSGSLYNVLSHIIYNGLNMNKVESRPIYGRNWEYRFFVDFEGNLDDSAVKNALRGIREEAINMKILGNY